jgi:triosephosphate isomerase
MLAGISSALVSAVSVLLIRRWPRDALIAMVRKFFVGGNWKMNGSKELAVSLCAALNEGSSSNGRPMALMAEVVVAPPAAYIQQVVEAVGPHVAVAGQNAHEKSSGAYTGEIRQASVPADVAALKC